MSIYQETATKIRDGINYMLEQGVILEQEPMVCAEHDTIYISFDSEYPCAADEERVVKRMEEIGWEVSDVGGFEIRT